MSKEKKIIIIGGAGHVGAPLGVALANVGFIVTLLDLNINNLNKLKQGIMPFIENGCENLLKKNIKKKRIFFSNNFDEIKKNKYIIISLGTNVKKLKPETKKFLSFFKFLKDKINSTQSVIIRSSIFPGTYQNVFSIIKVKCKNLTYCPERIAQGNSIKELPKISQIIGGNNKNEARKISKIFNKICKKILITTPENAELVKLFSNAYRYMNFAITNQFYTMCEKLNLNYKNIERLMKEGYPRNSGIPRAGFAGGPCLIKDTVQLSYFFKNKYPLLKDSRIINENLPQVVYEKIKKNYILKNKVVGILGAAFKPENDDIRDSLSIKLYKILKRKSIQTLISDEYYKNKIIVTKEYLIKNSDIVIIATPHKIYKNIKFRKKNIVFDLWGALNSN